MSKEGEAQNDREIYEINCIITVTFNFLSCPLTVLLNVLVIMAVIRRPRLQSNTNILLACLAAADIFTSLTAQPSFILWKISDLLGMKGPEKVFLVLHRCCIRTISICLSLHLMLVTCDRLIAIKFTEQYLHIVTKKNMKVAVAVAWAVSIFCGPSRALKSGTLLTFYNFFVSLTYLTCVVFILISYLILYRETRRHQKMIKTQQMPQDELERTAKENKALKTTVLVVGSVVLCFLPLVLVLVLGISGVYDASFSTFFPWVRTTIMFNSLLNPLIYCWRQKEMRKFVFKFGNRAVQPA